MNQSSLTNADQATLQRAAALADLRGADQVRGWAGATSYDITSTATAYAEAFSTAQTLLEDLADIIRRIDGTAATQGGMIP